MIFRDVDVGWLLKNMEKDGLLEGVALPQEGFNNNAEIVIST